MLDAWDVFARIEYLLRTPTNPSGALNGPGWFAALSGQDHGELNVCGLTGVATIDSARALTDAIGELPAVVFTSEHTSDDARAVLVESGFSVGSAAEPLMWCAAAPVPHVGPFRIGPATRDQAGEAIALTAEAHHVDAAMLTATIGAAFASGVARPWLAWDEDGPVSTVWLVDVDGVVGVNEMMTPSRHQRRGAGRQLLSTALAAVWTPQTRGALLLSTAAGRRLYESVGFEAVDEVVTCYRGLDEDVLEAIGQITSQ